MNTETKHCSGCEIKGINNGERPLKAFRKDNSSDGRKARCTVCESERLSHMTIRRTLEQMERDNIPLGENGELMADCICCRRRLPVTEFGRSSSQVKDTCKVCSHADYHGDQILEAIGVNGGFTYKLIHAIAKHPDAEFFIGELNKEVYPLADVDNTETPKAKAPQLHPQPFWTWKKIVLGGVIVGALAGWKLFF